MPGVTSAPLTVTLWPSIGTVAGMMLACSMPSAADGGHRPLEVERVLARHGVGLAADLGMAGPDRDQLLGLLVGQRREQDGVDDTEDGAVDADAERQCGDARDGEGAVTAEAADGIAGVLDQRFERRQSSAIAMGFGDRGHAAEPGERAPAGLFRRHAGAKVVGDVQIDVALQLVGELLLGVHAAARIR